MKLLTTSLLFVLALTTFAHTSAEWKSRTIYQVLTDRFAKTDNDTTPCSDFHNYCGGTFQGIINNLDYIQGMGFDAIWISPVIANTPGGYHGYWAQNINEINSYFGSSDDLKALVQACHAKDIWVMVDIVGNHMGPMQGGAGDFSDKVPFNDPSHYHNDVDCSQIDPNNQDQLQTCWLAQLPDLNQDNDFVKSTLLQWITNLVTTYDLDGLRIDTVPYVAKDFWSDFTQSAGVYTVGEVFNGNFGYDAGYQGPVSALLNYPLYFAIRNVFQQSQSMNGLQDYFNNAKNSWPDQTILGNFVDNHDNARFLSGNGNQVVFKAALAFSLTAVGIPIVYYGDEQAYSGGNDPYNREPLWTSMNPNSDIYGFLSTIINFRKSAQIYQYDQVQSYSDDTFYAFFRGQYYFAFTNNGQAQQRTITYHPYSNGTVLYNIFNSGDTITVQNGQFQISLNNGEVKIYTPNQSLISS